MEEDRLYPVISVHDISHKEHTTMIVVELDGTETKIDFTPGLENERMHRILDALMVVWYPYHLDKT